LRLIADVERLEAAEKAISQYTTPHEDEEHKPDCPCSMCAYLAKYGGPSWPQPL
jgi:hypothetical protein